LEAGKTYRLFLTSDKYSGFTDFHTIAAGHR
jgi:hypothetical protein